MNKLLLLLIIVAIESYAQYNIKLFHKKSSIINFILGIVLYIGIPYLLYLLYDKTKMGMSHVLLSGISIITILLIGSLFFNENISFNEWIGICLIVLGVIITQIE